MLRLFGQFGMRGLAGRLLVLIGKKPCSTAAFQLSSAAVLTENPRQNLVVGGPLTNANDDRS